MASNTVSHSSCTGEADIAITTTDGFVSLLHVRRDLTPLDGSQWSLTLKPLRLIDRGDKRAIGAVKWVDVGSRAVSSKKADVQQRSFLVWTKPGSVHFWSESRGNGITWEGLRTVKLDRVGNWASANAFSPCVGRSFSMCL